MKGPLISLRHLASASKGLTRRLTRLRREREKLSAALDHLEKRRACWDNSIGAK